MESYRLAPFRLCGRFLVPPSLTFPQSPFVITDGRISRVRLATLVVLRRPFRIQGSLSALPHSPLFDTVSRALLARTESPFPFSGFSPSRVRLQATWAPTQQRSLGPLARFLPRDLGLTSRTPRFGSPDYPCLATSTGRHISGLQSSPQLQAPRLARPPDCSLRFFPSAAAPSSSRIARLLTCPKMGSRYVCESSNSHGWTFTIWIVTLSVAPPCLCLLPRPYVGPFP